MNRDTHDEDLEDEDLDDEDEAPAHPVDFHTVTGVRGFYVAVYAGEPICTVRAIRGGGWRITYLTSPTGCWEGIGADLATAMAYIRANAPAIYDGGPE